MTVVDWFFTGRNNAFDWLMYAPPGSFRGYRIAGLAYRLGWLVGMWGYPFNRRRKYWRSFPTEVRGSDIKTSEKP